MQYVIDASVALKWFLPEPYSDKADALLQRFLHQGLSLVSPDLLVPEVGNALWKRSALQAEIPLSDAQESYRDFLRLQVPLESSSVIANDAFNLAAQEQQTVYDALYVALALQRGCEFVTADQTLVTKLVRKFPQIRPLGSL